jgi:hypothetical protein
MLSAMRYFSLAGGCVLVLAGALLAMYVSGERIPPIVPAVIVFVAVVSWFGTTNRHGPNRQRNDVLMKVARLFDPGSCSTVSATVQQDMSLSRICGRIGGRESEFSFWLPQDHPLEMSKLELAVSTLRFERRSWR